VVPEPEAVPSLEDLIDAVTLDGGEALKDLSAGEVIAISLGIGAVVGLVAANMPQVIKLAK